MKISKDFQKFHLHDGIINQVLYRPESKELVLYIELAYTSPPELGTSGQMVFSGVEQLKTDSPLEDIDWINDVWGEIKTADFTSYQNIDTLETMSWYVLLYRRGRDYNESYMLHLEFVAESFEWLPDK
ncbi:MAG: hypothetical protein SF029_17690 [bacterium]|nr:hypothetical protein [bacterium]